MSISCQSSNFSVRYHRNHWTLGIGVLGYIVIVWPKEHSPEVRSFPPGTPCIYIIPINSNFNNTFFQYWHEDYRIFVIFHKLIPITLSQLLFSLKNVKYTSTAADQHQHHSAWTKSDRLVYNRLQTVVAQILTTLMSRRNILAPRMAMAVMVHVRLV